MGTIGLSQGQTAIVDDEDVDFLNQWAWFAGWRKSGWYATRWGEGKPKRRVDMAHVVFERDGKELRVGEVLDHINRNSLDNRSENLRGASLVQNALNQRKRNGCSSVYKGVAWNKRLGKWEVSSRVGMGRKERKYLGLFDDENEAGAAYDAWAIAVGGEDLDYVLLNRDSGVAI